MKQLPPAEERFATELAFLTAAEELEKPAGWGMSPQSVVTFICGSDSEKLKLPKGAKVSKGVPKTLAISESLLAPARWLNGVL